MSLTSDRRERIHRVLTDALAKAPEERASFVAGACEDDAEVRAEVESMLAHDEQAGEDFMSVPEPDARFSLRGIADGPDPRIGTKIGKYDIESVIGSGGMGTVYLATQEQPKRHVAMKVMNTGVSSRSALRRFQYESQILAKLRHPGIAQVYEAGTHSDADSPGRAVPYFVMEYIPEAQTLIKYAKEKKLGTRERLELFAKVCDAVQHGHQKGIIHRDLKPGNILVDSSGQIKVIDFGIARSTDSDVAITTLRTDVGQLIGTVQYMSPEQCAADPDELDTRSDVYSLGVVLYELLCEQLPYDVTRVAVFEATRVVREEMPPRPSTINRKLKGDIETVVLKAIEKDREKRYQSAADLAQDIRRYLNGEPIDAKPMTTLTRVLRWVTRHPVLATGTACFITAVIIIGATYVTVWFTNALPHEIMCFRDGQIVKASEPKPIENMDEVRLLARSKNILHTWGNGRGSICFAELVDHTTESGERRLAVLGFDPRHDGPLRGALCAFDIDGDLDKPVWQRRVEDGNPLPDPYGRGYKATEFWVSFFWLYDVFPSSPGPEIVAKFSHVRFSQRIIRIYDLNGQLLYEKWHDGTANTCYWMEDAGLLVFAGSDASVNWGQDGEMHTTGGDPLVVFAIRPELGQTAPGYLYRFGGKEDASVVWRRYLHLNDRLMGMRNKWTLKVGRSLTAYTEKRFVNVIALHRAAWADVSWDLDEFGKEVPESRKAGDCYQHNRKEYPDEDDPQRLPDPDDFHLSGDLPPIIASPPSSQKAPPVESVTP